MKFISPLPIMSLLLLSLSAYTQNRRTDNRFNLLDSNINQAVAFKDIISHKMKIFGQGGISPTAYGKADSMFESRYRIIYILFGCESPYSYKQMKEYNLEIGKFLDQTYGSVWRKELHEDVIALKE